MELVINVLQLDLTQDMVCKTVPKNVECQTEYIITNSPHIFKVVSLIIYPTVTSKT